jgi:DNA-binding NarL/FixJ family response regulator
MTSSNIPPLPFAPDEWDRLATKLKLSPQQTRIIELILRNCCDKRIAAELGLKVPTVRTYLSRIFLRLGVDDRMSLVLKIFAASRDTPPANDCHRQQ